MGLVIASLFWVFSPLQLSEVELEKEARQRLGMIYPEENLPWEVKAEESTEQKEETNKGDIPEIVEIEIPAGSTLNMVSSILWEKGIIEDISFFEQKMQENNLARRIKAGKYQIKVNSSLEEIISLLTE